MLNRMVGVTVKVSFAPSVGEVLSAKLLTYNNLPVLSEVVAMKYPVAAVQVPVAGPNEIDEAG